jgi:hypothetical protein
MSDGKTSQRIQSILRAGKDALARCDSARLEEILIHSSALSDVAETAWYLESEKTIEVDAFIRILELTRENLRVIRGSRHLWPVDLEYQPSGRRTQRGAMY